MFFEEVDEIHRKGGKLIDFAEYENIIKSLGISGVSTSESCWFSKPGKDTDEQRAQIDLVIDRADGCINLCEIKFHNSKFKIDKNFVLNQRNKIERFRMATQTRKSIFTALISTFGVEENQLYHEIIDNQLMMDDLFCLKNQLLGSLTNPILMLSN